MSPKTAIGKKPKWPKILKKILEISVIVLAAGYLLKLISQNWLLVLDHLEQANWYYLVVALILFGLFFICRAFAWWIILRSFNIRLPILKASYIWLISEFSRYIPGNIWSFFSRIYLAESAGVPKKQTAISLILEIIFLALASLIFAGFFFLLAPSQIPEIPRWPFILSIPLIALVFSPKLLNRFTNWGLSLFKRPPIVFNLAFPKILQILFVYIFGWFVYGLGSYLVLVAFVPHQSVNWFWLMCAFIVAWAIGYFSFITPMGIGVREGALTVILGPIISFPLASFIAIASRLWFMGGELITLGSATISYRVNQWQKQKINYRLWIKERWPQIVLVILILAYIAYFTTLTFLRHANFISSRFDLGNMDQIIWNTSQGRFFQMTHPTGEINISRFVFHGDIFLVILAPLYWVLSSPYLLLFLQTVILALGALPLFWLGRDILKNKPIALVISFAYLMFPPMQRANIFDFHAVTLATTFIIFAFYYAYRKHYLPFALFALLTLSTKENMAFIVATLGIYILIAQKNWRVGLTTIVLSLGWFYVLLWHIIPSIPGGKGAHFALNYYADLGGSPTEIFRSLLISPQKWLIHLFNIGNLRYLAYFTLPTGMFALLSPIFWLSSPELALNMLSSYYAMHTIYYQYTSAITPFAFLSTIFGIQVFKNRIIPFFQKRFHFAQITESRLNFSIILYLLLTLALTSWRWSPLPKMERADIKAFVYHHPSADYLTKLARTIPKEASVSATTNMSPHFMYHRESFMFPRAVGKVDYIIVQEGDRFELGTIEEISQAIRKLETDPRYVRIYQKGQVQVFRKR